jgi:hypothetical protein
LSVRVAGKPWHPRGAGVFQCSDGHGKLRYHRSREKNETIQKNKGDERRKLRRADLPPEWRTPILIEGERYSRAELAFIADEMLRADFKVRPNSDYPVVLLEEHLKPRRKREIYVGNGIPDPSVASGLYNRTHPEGRKFHTDPAMRKEHGFYI